MPGLTASADGAIPQKNAVDWTKISLGGIPGINTQINRGKTFIDPVELAQQASKLQAQTQTQTQPQQQSQLQPQPVTLQMSNLYKQYAQANDYTGKLQKQADDYQKQADENAIKLPDIAQKVRAGLAKQDEYNALASQVQALRSQADSARRLAENYQNDSDTYKKGMDQLAAEQKPAPQVGTGLFDTPDEAAADFAKRAMPLTDNTAHEYSAVMTEVMVPEYKDGKMQMVPKYKYGDIIPGELNNVVNNAMAGLLKPSEGKKYLLHTHPDNEIYDPDHFSGLPNPLEQIYQKYPDQKYFLSQPILGDASMPTLTGSSWYSPLNILTKLAGISNGFISGYDGIYLAAPTGKMYLYNGWGNDRANNLASDFGTLRALQSQPINGVNIPKTRGKWNGHTGEYNYYNNP